MASGKTIRYWQPPNSIPRVYFPPFLIDGKDWTAISADPSIDVYITEGEKKGRQSLH